MHVNRFDALVYPAHLLMKGVSYGDSYSSIITNNHGFNLHMKRSVSCTDALLSHTAHTTYGHWVKEKQRLLIIPGKVGLISVVSAHHPW